MTREILLKKREWQTMSIRLRTQELESLAIWRLAKKRELKEQIKWHYGNRKAYDDMLKEIG